MKITNKTMRIPVPTQNPTNGNTEVAEAVAALLAAALLPFIL